MRDKAERAMQGLALLMALVLFFTVVALTSGCYTPDCGSKTVVGNHYSLPKISSDSTDFDFEIYESTEGAVVYTRKDSRVGITFSNVYTNCIFGIWDKAGLMTLAVEIEPLATEGAEETGGDARLASAAPALVEQEMAGEISDFRSQISESEGKAPGAEESEGKAPGAEEAGGEEKSGEKGKTLGLEKGEGKEEAE